MRSFFKPAEAPMWLGQVLASIRASLSDQWPTPLRLASFTVAKVPPAEDWAGAVIYVPDESGGAVPAFSDGTDWLRVTDRTVIS